MDTEEEDELVHMYEQGALEETQETECDDCGLLRGIKGAHGSVRDATEDERRNFFHAPCTSCLPEDDSLDFPLLCTVCKHMRLRHIFQCLSLERNFLLQLGTVQELEERRDCNFCSFVLDVISKLKKERFEEIRAHAWVGIDTYELKGLTYLDVAIIGFQQEAAKLRVQVENTRNTISQPSSDSILSEMVPWEKVKAWMSDCEGRPEYAQDGPPSPLPEKFRLIDVRKRCIVVMPVGANYSFVALSYVWGAEPKGKSTTALRNNIAHLQTPGSLDLLPATIEDGIQVCRQLDERYLWADRLCVIQDDLEDKRAQISSMGSIYSSASLVIIAACGGHMDAGLAGVLQPRRIPFPRQVLPELRFTPQFSHYWGIHQETIWASRGWTYQEGVLARRKLLFTPTEVWFDCSHGIRREVGDPWTLRPISLFRPGEFKDMFDEFMRHMRTYARRQLTNQSDVYSAIEGIMSELYKDSGGRHYYGLPCQDFDRALLWMCSHVPGKSPLRTSERTYLPTWSWSSFNGGINDLPNNSCHHHCSTLLKWATYHEGEDGLELRYLEPASAPLVWREAGRYPEGIEIDEPYWYPQLYLALACEQGVIEGLSNESLPWDTTSPFASRRAALLSRFPTYSSFWTEIKRLRQPPHSHCGSSSLAFLDDTVRGRIPREDLKPGPLVVRAQIARFRIGKHGADECRSRVPRLCHHCDVVDEAGLSCGYVYPDEPRITPALPVDTLVAFDLMALSISVKNLGGVEKAVGVQESSEELERLVKDENEEITFFDCVGEALMPCPAVNVMVVGRRSDGVLYRMGVGWILMRSWVKAVPRFETVMLE